MSHELIIRHMEPGDLGQIHALYSENEAYANTLQLPFQPQAAWEKKLQIQDGFYSLVAVRGDEIVGQLGLQHFRSPRRQHVASFGMGVKAATRRQGVGSALVDAAVDLCQRWLNVRRIEIEVYCDNAAAVALYQKHGFLTEGTFRDFAFRDGRYVDVHAMARFATI